MPRPLPAVASPLVRLDLDRKESVGPGGRLVRRTGGRALLNRVVTIADAPSLIPPVPTGFRRVRTLIEATIGSRMLYYRVTDEEL